MSFFRNLRSSITRGRSSSRDTTPVRSSRPGSVLSGGSKRRDSMESSCDSVFNRSDTFIMDQSSGNGLTSNTSTLEKKSKKSKVLEKFSTFTKRKKTPAPDSCSYEHHPSDNATNTYYKWQADGGSNSLDYDSQTDPFNFLYDESSLKSLHNGSSGPESVRSMSTSGTTKPFDSSTYRKGKMPTELKKQLEQLKQGQKLKDSMEPQATARQRPQVQEEEEEDETHGHEDRHKLSGFEQQTDENKYKTITLNSFRKSFRDKFLKQQKEAPHNPSWFVEVDPPLPMGSGKDRRERSDSKENRTDFLVFENDNYRPGSRSPIRDLQSRRQARSSTRSPVKRNETFKVERSPVKSQPQNPPEPSIRIEFRNSITPNLPGRMVPVGVAKPMVSTHTPYYGQRQDTPSKGPYGSSYSIKTSSSTRLNQSPVRNWSKAVAATTAQSPSRLTSTAAVTGSQRTGRYQTLVQIKNEANSQNGKLQASPGISIRPSRQSTRIQLGGTQSSVALPPAAGSPSFGKRLANSPLASKPLRQTYFGDNQQYGGGDGGSGAVASTASGRLYHSPSVTRHSRPLTQRPAANAPATNYKYQSTPAFPALAQARGAPTLSGAGGAGAGFSYPRQQHQQQQQQQQQPATRLVVAAQRRSRSPIKIPWR